MKIPSTSHSYAVVLYCIAITFTFFASSCRSPKEITKSYRVRDLGAIEDRNVSKDWQQVKK